MAADPPFPLMARAAAGGRSRWAAPALLVLAGFFAYLGSFRVPFLFDDVPSIVENETIRRLWPPWEALSPPPGWGLTVSGRPVLNVSLAVNYAISGLDPWSYHAVNLLIHVLAAVTLSAFLRRTLQRVGAWTARGAEWRGWLIALLWVLHPLQVESVTYVVQRAESLMGLWLLLSLWAFERSTDARHPRAWSLVAVICAWLAVGTKEVAVMIPVLAFLYDRTFISGRFREAWRRHRGRHLLLATCWIPLSWLVFSTGGNRGGTMGFGLDLSWTDYLLVQLEAVVRYVGLSLWPHPLIFDYGIVTPRSGITLLLFAIAVALLFGATVYALWRHSPLGFLGAWFFILLAPTSLVPGALQQIVEHRMYLPLAAVLTAAVLVLAPHHRRPTRFARVGLAAFATVWAGAFALLTWQRNMIFADEEALWLDTLKHRPENGRAFNNLGRLYLERGRPEEARSSLERAAVLSPDLAHIHYNLGLAQYHLTHYTEAIRAWQQAVRLLPQHRDAHLELGRAFRALGAWSEAYEHFTRVQELAPHDPEAAASLGEAAMQLGRPEEAVQHYEQAIALQPTQPNLHFNLGLAQAARGSVAAAQAAYAEAVRLDPRHAAARLNLGIALGQAGHLNDAILHLEHVTQLRPDWTDAYSNLGVAYLTAGRPTDAVEAFERARTLQPPSAEACYQAAYALLVAQRRPEALAALREALRIDQNHTAARALWLQLQNEP